MSFKCPYCGAELEEPENEGFSESETYEEECSECGKHFVFMVCYSVNFDARQADCLNGEPHDWEDVLATDEYMKNFYSAYRRCRGCDKDERIEKPQEASK